MQTNESANTATQPAYNTELYEILRVLRKQIATQKQVPLYMIMSNASLEAISLYLPQTKELLSQIKGIGRYKIYAYGDIFVAAISKFCKEHAIQPQIVSDAMADRRTDTAKVKSVETSMLYFKQGLTVEEIAELRKLSVPTIKSHLLQAYANGAPIAIDSFVSEEKQQFLGNVFTSLKTNNLTSVMEYLTNGYSYDDLRWVRAKMQRETTIETKPLQQ